MQASLLIHGKANLEKKKRKKLTSHEEDKTLVSLFTPFQFDPRNRTIWKINKDGTKKERCKGLTHFLNSFYEKSCHTTPSGLQLTLENKNTETNQETKKRKKTEVKKGEKKFWKKNRFKPLLGQKGGTALDTAVNQIVMRSTIEPEMTTTSPSAARIIPGGGQGKKVIITARVGAKKLNDRLRSYGMLPVAAQVGVGCDTTNLSTLIDSIWYDPKSDTLWIVEVKLFNKDEVFDTCFPWPFDKWRRTLLQQHRIQLGCTTWLFAHCFGQNRYTLFSKSKQANPISRVKGMLVLVSGSGRELKSEILPAEIWKGCSELMEHLCLCTKLKR
jgi:hypothetical protein